MTEVLSKQEEKYLLERMRAQSIGVEKTHELVAFGVDDMNTDGIEALVNEIDCYDETTRSVIGMGLCLPSLIEYERQSSHNKYDDKEDGKKTDKYRNTSHKRKKDKSSDLDYKRTTLFNHYLNSYIESMEYPEAAPALMHLMQKLLEGRMNVSSDELLDRFSSAFVGQWNEQAVENALIANKCICSEGSVDQDGEGVDLFVVGNTGSIYKVDVKSSFGALESFGKAFVSKDGIEGYQEEEASKYYSTPGFAVSLGPKKSNILLVITGVGRPISRQKNRNIITGALEEKVVFMPVPKFGHGGDFDMSEPIAMLKSRYLAIAGAAKINFNNQEIEEKFGRNAARIILNNQVAR